MSKLSQLLLGLIASCLGAVNFQAQPSFEASPPSRVVVEDGAERRADYLARIKEVYDSRIERYDLGVSQRANIMTVLMLLDRNERIDVCSRHVIELMRSHRTGPFGMFPSVLLAYAGRDKLSSEARGAIRETWRKRQGRGDTENHWIMYYTSLYLMSQLYPNESGEEWYTGKSSEENLAEARGWLLDWMEITTTRGQGEYNPSYYFGEYALTMLMLASLSDDDEMGQRGYMMLDWLCAELATVTLEGVLRGPNSRTDEKAIPERWNAPVTSFSWLLFGNTSPIRNYGSFAAYFAVLGDNYEVPEVIYRIATDRRGDILQRDRARARRIWRYSDEHMPPIYKIQYLRRDYAVGSHQGRVSDPIQSHVWDVTWREDDPRGKYTTMFSVHPHSSAKVMQMFFSSDPEALLESLATGGKPSYGSPDKIMGSSPYEQVFQNLDTVIALYDIDPKESFPRINGFFSKDLKYVTEHESGWIFAQGGETYLAYRPLASYEWIPHLNYRPAPRGNYRRAYVKYDTGSRVLVSPHVKNGTILQAASTDEFKNFEAFQAAINALPLEYQLDPVPSVKMGTLRGKELSFTYGETPLVDGVPVDYSQWKLFGGTHLNSEVGSRILTITHGSLQRVLDFNTLTISDTINQP